MPINPYTITWLLMSIGFIVFIVLIVKARIDKKPVELYSVESLGLLLCTLFLYWLVTPGSEHRAKYGTLDFYSKAPSFLAQLLGNKETSFEINNNDNRNYDRIILSASSEETFPQVDILEGIVEEMKNIDRENTRFYFAEIPPGGRLSGTSPAEVQLTPIPWQAFPKGTFPKLSQDTGK